MCGICGAVQLGGAPKEVLGVDTLERMTDLMSHRGPDDRGTYLAPGVALGVRRLSIVDVEEGHQPVSSEDRNVWAIQNGELYNHIPVRRQLEQQGHRFLSRCDTEILPHLYEQHGDRFPELLRGMFGLAVWDGARRRAVLARDRLGIKPLYYSVCGDVLVFASELKSLLASGLVDGGLDYEAIDAFLTLGFFPTPATPLAGVSKLPPGHRLVVERGKVRIESYWSYPAPTVSPESVSPEEWAERLLEELEESVRLRLMSDVPLGAMLSGGLDSSLIVALMARNMTEPVKTFSVGFAEAGAGNELREARLVAEHLGCEHHELELSFHSLEVDLRNLVWHLDEPLADLSSLGFLALSELASEHVTVALSGQGADELFGGYNKHRAASLAGRWRRAPWALRRPAELVAARGPDRIRRAARTVAAADPATRLLAMSGNIDPTLRHRLVRGPLAELDGLAARRAIAACLDGVPDDPLPVTLYLDAQLGLVDDMLHYFDRASMAHSLEVRVPFLDHHVVEFAAGVPARQKVQGTTTKAVLKRAARGIVPDSIIDRPKIGFFNGAVAGWFSAQANGAIADWLLTERPCYSEFIDRGEVERLVREHLSGAAGENGRAHALLSILMLEIWLADYLPRAQSSAPQAVSVC